MTFSLVALPGRADSLANKARIASLRSSGDCMARNGRPGARCSIESALWIACCIVSGARVCVVILAMYGNVAAIARPQCSPYCALSPLSFAPRLNYFLPLFT